MACTRIPARSDPFPPNRRVACTHADVCVWEGGEEWHSPYSRSVRFFRDPANTVGNGPTTAVFCSTRSSMHDSDEKAAGKALTCEARRREAGAAGRGISRHASRCLWPKLAA
jgi:hypothetical protein